MPWLFDFGEWDRDGVVSSTRWIGGKGGVIMVALHTSMISKRTRAWYFLWPDKKPGQLTFSLPPDSN